MKFNNPIISGFHPDPSICRVNEDYYLVTSSFEYFPGIPIFHSRDLLHWNQIGHCITEANALQLKQGHPNALGLYAPTIRYHKGIFYVICTNVALGEKDDGNFIVWTKDPTKGWSKPIFLDCPGIDPSLFFDEDGAVYYSGTHEQIYLCELDLQNGTLLSPKRNIWSGSGANNPEGPHIYKRNGYYYLLIAEGGTELGHMVTIARSKHIYGPYESCPRNPILTNRGTEYPIKAVGHADIFEDQNGHWWAVCLGIRTISYPFRHNLGRETMLIPMIWDEDGWPRFEEGHLKEEIDTNQLPISQFHQSPQIREWSWVDKFQKEGLNYSWNFIYNPDKSLWQITEKGLSLKGNADTLSHAGSIAWLGCRQQHHNCVVRTKVTFGAQNDNEEAGLCIYLNNLHHYEIALTKRRGQTTLIVRRQIGSLWRIENEVKVDRESIILRIEASKERYLLQYERDDEVIAIGSGETNYLTTEVGGIFTGNYFGLYASGNGKPSDTEAFFHWFEYQGRE